MTHFDTLIKNARIVDGRMTPAYMGDIGIIDGKIVEIGKIDAEADKVYDVEGKLVTPGFIDMHTHFDAQVFWDPNLTPSCLFGITTVMMTNCGFALAPVKKEDHDWALRMLSRVEGMPLESLQTLDISWETYPEYLDTVAAQPLGVNIGCMVPHSVGRYYVMGDDARERSDPTPEELEAMKDYLREGIEAGGFGLSSTRLPAHKDGDGKNVPSYIASDEEFLALAEVQQEYPNTNIEYTPTGLGGGMSRETIGFMGDLSRAAGGKPINWNAMVDFAGAKGAWKNYLKWMHEENEAGSRIYSIGVVSPLDAEIVLATAGNLFDDHPHWTMALQGDNEHRMKLLSDTSHREKMKNDLETIKGTFPPNEWHRIEVSRVETPENEKYLGRYVKEIADEEGKHPVDVFLDLSTSEDLKTGFYFHSFLNEDEDSIDQYMQDKFVIPGISDGGAHLDYLCSYGWPIHYLSKNIKERGTESLENAVRRITTLPFSIIGITDRGYIGVGAAADLVVIDYDKLDYTPSKPVRDLPAGAVRRVHEPIGIEHVFVNGVETIRENEFTGANTGKVLRSYDYRKC